MTSPPSDVLLQGTAVSRSFGGLRALDAVEFHLAPAEAVGLIGPNGSGKTTLIDVITGNLRASSGQLHFRGRAIGELAPHRIARLGIARTFQRSRSFQGMTVEDNILVGAIFGSTRASRDHRRRLAEAERVMALLGLEGRRHERVDTLNVPDRKKVDLGRALAMSPEALLLDELMAGLDPTEIDEMIRVVRQIQRGGVALLVIEHVMNVITRLCSRVVVLHRGRKIADAPVDDVARDPVVLEAYLGRRDPGVLHRRGRDGATS